MTKVAVLGSEQFVLGFRLAGIQKAVINADDVWNDVKDFMNSDISIVLCEQKAIDTLDDQDRMDVESSISPVFVQISEEGGMDNLKKIIKKSIGIDILDE